jgi:cytochrome c
MRSSTLTILLMVLLPCASADTESGSWLLQGWVGPGLGRELPLKDAESLPRHVFPDGRGLPEGEGRAVDGALLYAESCAGCHGTQGQGGRAMELVGDRSLLTTEYPDKGIAVYWPHAPTLFEYIYRSMPPDKPASLTTDELYAVIAHLLTLNGLLEEGDLLNATALSNITLPNRQGFRTVGH